MANGELKKMLIVGYSDDTFKGKETGRYEVLINPDSYALTYEIVRTDKAGEGAPSGSPTYSRSPSQTISFKFLFDGTGVIQASAPGSGPDFSQLSTLGQNKSKRDVTADLNAFSTIVYAFDGKTHQPGYVQLRWGTLYYNCCLQKMTITMKLFAPDGTPLRAEADCTFTSVVDQKTQVAATKPQSPDLSHVRTVRKGDTLPLLCYDEYGDSKYYYQVAQYNGLTDFKILTPGTKLIFPPFAK